jgi:YD repeat-containing protein
MLPPLAIAALAPSDFDTFLAYLNDHLSDNGQAGTGYFQPLPRLASHFPADRAQAFRTGLQAAVGAPGWRRLWVARDEQGRIAGHIDLRGRAEVLAPHRCLLGMGVDRAHRRRGLGQRLIAHALQWASTVGQLEWVDLHVLSANEAAVALYRTAGFDKTGEIADMFRIDGQGHAYTSMCKRLAR